MVSRQSIIDALSSTLGQYIVDLDAPSLSFSIKSGGKIEFPHGLKLNADAINKDYLCPDSDGAAKNNGVGGPFSAKEGIGISGIKKNSGLFGSFMRQRHRQHHVGGGGTVSSRKSRRSAHTASSTGSFSEMSMLLPQQEVSGRGGDESSTSPKNYLNEDWTINVNGHKNRRHNGKQSQSHRHPFFLDELSSILSNANVRVKSGFIHKLSIEIPWKALASSPIVIRITG
eukprot:943726-Ditylum_brightwellii.AAC.1